MGLSKRLSDINKLPRTYTTKGHKVISSLA